MLTSLLLCAFSLACLAGGAEALVRGAVTLARRWGMSSLFIGLTIVGFGTSTPELASSALAALRDQSGLAVGNVLGSNLFNIAVIVGVTALARPVIVRIEQVRAEVLVAIGAGAMPFVALFTAYRFERWFGVVLLAMLGLYLFWGFRRARRETDPAADEAEAALEDAIALGRPGVAALLVLAGLATLVFGAGLLVENASVLARHLGMSELLIGLTIVAAGTSMPELVTSLTAARRGEHDLVIGNVVGSNIFNILGVLGLTAVVQPFAVARQALLVDAVAALAAGLALLPILTTQHRVSRMEGAVLVGAYVAFLIARATVIPDLFA